MGFFRVIFKFIVTMFALFGFLVFLIIAGGAAAIYQMKKERFLIPTETILSLTVDGNIVEYASRDQILREVLGPTVTMLDIVAQLENAAEDEQVKGLLLRIADHELSYAQIQEIRDAVIAFRRSGKPAVAYADSFGELTRGMASYYLATSCDEIYLQPSGTLDLSGISAETPFLKGLLAKIGVQPIGETRKEYKNYWNIFTEEKYTGPHREAVHRVLETIFSRMVADIAAARKLDPATARALVDRSPFFAAEAVAEGLIDGVKFRDEVLAHIEQKAACAKYTPLYRYEPTFPPDTATEATVAVVIAEGEIHRGKSRLDPFGRSNRIGGDSLAKAIRDAAADPQVQAIVLRVNSPGGSVVASETIWREVASAVKEAQKPVIVTMGSVAASGGYYISMAADRIIAQPATLTGSIGVIIGKMYTPDMWKKIGVTFDSDQIGKNARLFSSLTKLDADQTALLRRMLDSIYDTFVSRAAAGRKKDPGEIEPFAKGRVWTGEDALAHGLVDEMGGYAAAFAEVRRRFGLQPQAMISLKYYPPEPNFLDLLLDRDHDDDVAAPVGLIADLSAGARKVLSLLFFAEDMGKRENFELSADPVDIR